MAKTSAGLLLYRLSGPQPEVFLVHPGGPYWAKKDAGAWSIPKGEYAAGESPRAAALREFTEETGFAVHGEADELTTLRQAGGKIVSVWTLEGDCDAAKLVSNTCRVEWPPRSGRTIEIPEVDRGAWFTLDEAETRILKSQLPALSQLRARLKIG